VEHCPPLYIGDFSTTILVDSKSESLTPGRNIIRESKKLENFHMGHCQVSIVPVRVGLNMCPLIPISQHHPLTSGLLASCKVIELVPVLEMD
jgi:hypothetical protein